MWGILARFFSAAVPRSGSRDGERGRRRRRLPAPLRGGLPAPPGLLSLPSTLEQRAAACATGGKARRGARKAAAAAASPGGRAGGSTCWRSSGSAKGRPAATAATALRPVPPGKGGGAGREGGRLLALARGAGLQGSFGPFAGRFWKCSSSPLAIRRACLS